MNVFTDTAKMLHLRTIYIYIVLHVIMHLVADGN